MKRFLRTSFVAVVGVFVAAAAPALAQTPKFGYINSQRILAEAPGAVAAQQQFEREMQTFRSEIQPIEQQLETLQPQLEKQMQELQTMVQEYERQQSTLTADARQAREREIRQKQESFEAQRDEYQQVLLTYQQKRQELEQKAQQRQQELVGPIMQQVSQVIETIREEGNYAMIFDVAGGTMLVAADPSLDLSDQVLARLQSTNQSGR